MRFHALYSKVIRVNERGVVVEPLRRCFNRPQMNEEDYLGVKTCNAA